MRELSPAASLLLAAGLWTRCCCLWAGGQVSTPAVADETATVEYLGDHLDLMLSTSQAWGELGWNVAAHQSGQAGMPLQIGERTYAKGLGHHANGSIEVLLEGQYASFDAEVGLQPCGGGGSVIFRVLVDGGQRFDSGILRATDMPKPIHIDLAGAQDLRLEANDAGDGITCDMANWANARLTPAGDAASHAPEPSVDIARFARVVTWEPNRTDGARANRIEEFRAEDLFLESNVPRQPDGIYRVPLSTNKLGCIGLQWLNRRALKELALEFPSGVRIPLTNAVQVQGWFGESAWQGNWKPLEGEIHAVGNRMVFRLSPNAGVVQTQKVRWIFPASEQTAVRSLSAFTRSHWQTVKLLVEAEEPARGASGELVVCNGEFLTNGSSRHQGVLLKSPAGSKVGQHARNEALIESPAAHTSRLALEHAADLRTDILRAYRWTQAQAPALLLHNGTWIPHYPSQVHSPGKLADFFPGQDAGRSWCYDVEIGAHQLVPTGVFDPHEREVERMLDHMEDMQFLADGWFDYPAATNERDWFNLGGFSKVQPYYTRNCEVYALRDDVKPFVRSYFNTIAAMLNPEVLTLWEHFHHSGAWDKTHETGYFLHQTRTMLVTERGDQLWLAPFITSNWLRDGQTLSVSNAPTRFGPVSYEIQSHMTEGVIRATIHPPARRTPNGIVLRLRTPEGSPIRSVRVNGRPHSDFDKTAGLVRLTPARAVLRLEVFFRQPKG
jgi:hypothetical protein